MFLCFYSMQKDLENKLADYAKLNDLEDFILRDTYIEEKDKARLVADQINVSESKQLLTFMKTNKNEIFCGV